MMHSIGRVTTLDESKSANLSRRAFLGMAVKTGGAAAVMASAASWMLFNHRAGGETVARLNPAFTIARGEGSEIELVTQMTNGRTVRRAYGGLEAACLVEAQREQKIATITRSLTAAGLVSRREGRHQVEQVLGRLEQAGLVYFGERILVRISENRYGG